MKPNAINQLTGRFLALDIPARTMQIAGLIRFVCIFLQGIILVKAGVPLQIVGQIELVFFVANFFMFFWQNGNSNAMMSWASGEERMRVAGAIFSATHIHAFMAVLLLFGVAQLSFGGRFDILSSTNILTAILIYVFFSIPSGAITYAYLIRQRLGAILWYTGVSQLIQLSVVVGIIVAGYPIVDMLWVLAVFAVTKWLFVLVSGRWFVFGMPKATQIWTFVVFALPLIIHAFNSGLMDYVDGWIVSLVYGEEQFAIYRYGAREFPFNVLLIGGLVSGMVYRFRTNAIVDASVLRQETLRIMHLLFPITCVLILLSAPLYTLLYNEDFALSARVFNIYALTLLSRIIINQVYCYVHHQNWVLTWTTIAEVVINVVLSLLFLRWIGLLGIPLATVIAYGLQKIFLIIYVNKKFGARPSEYLPIAHCIWYFVLMISCVVLAELMYF